MREVFTMWRHTQMVVLTALSAAIFAAVLIIFKPFVIVPGFTELRPANVFPFVFALLFGPAGAWGAAIGNLIGDFFGTLGLGSISGVVGNFFLGLVTYKLWGAIFPNNIAQTIDSRRKFLGYVGVVLAASAACALWIAWFNDLLGNVPFAVLGTVITLNNAVMGIILGPILLLVLYPRIKRWGLLWTEIMEPEEVSPARGGSLGAVLVAIGSVGGIAFGLVLGFGPASTMGGLGIGAGMLPFLAFIVVGSMMLGGREQVVAEQTKGVR